MKPITLTEYEALLKSVNFDYQKEQCASVWNEGRRQFEKASQCSFQSVEHRRLFIEYKGLNNK